ncbi:MULTISPECIES: hypothetical protein [unclassified Streptomyces]|uniref:hypothetical protein n=1 Tax=unclassified Streptomyces TaxID=2593676 RepID=UPI00190B5C3E|nr:MULTISPECIES: hypothetical protein [unclassified Streptomyces]MBK3563248.1 hypothetical protein [Streptomyces sp. MBT62]MBK6018007.1 hypothetical protein [Streptomyces sp. MBT53]
MKRFARMRLRAGTLLTGFAALASTTLGVGLIQAPQAQADTTGCGGLINNNFAYCIKSESDYGLPIEDPWVPTAADQKYMDQSVIVSRCLTSSDNHCNSDSGANGIAWWQIDKIAWVNPRMSEYTDSSQVASSASDYGCTSGQKGITTTFVPGHGTTFESFGFLPDLGGEKEYHPNYLSKAFGLSASLLGDLTFGASTPSSWQLGETQTVNIPAGYKGWVNITPGFVKLQGEAILHMQYRWGGSSVWHHKDLRVRAATLVLPHMVSFNGSKYQSAVSAFRDTTMSRADWKQYCSGQSPSPYHNPQVKVYSNTKGIEVIDHSTGYDHCFSLTSATKPAWLDVHASSSGTSVFQKDNVEVRWYSSILCGYPHAAAPNHSFKHTAPLIDGLTNWWIK